MNARENQPLITKVLIATIGNPKYVYSKDQYGEEQLATSYQKTLYQYQDRTCLSAYTFDALNSILNIDKIILMGTANSHWHELYRYIFQPENHFSALSNGQKFNEEYFETLQRLSTSKDSYQLDVKEISSVLSKLRNSMSNCLDIIILQPGMNDTEWEKNLHSLRHLDDILPEKSALYIDITCGFRSLPLYEFLSILYMQGISEKMININLLTYAQFDSSNSDVTPFISLNVMNETLSYIQLVNEYKQFGTIHSISPISRDISDALTRKTGQIIKALSDHISFNNIDGLKSSIQRIHDLLSSEETDSKDASLRTRLLKDFVFMDLDNRFYSKLDNEYLLQYELAIWHFERKRYLVSATTAVECTITYAADLLNEKDCDHERRQAFSRALSRKNSTMNNSAIKRLKRTYDEIRLIRNELAHPRGHYQDNHQLSADLKNHLESIQRIYQELFMENTTNANRLIECLKNDLEA